MSEVKTLIIVFGMHRSGTSLLTKLLVELGYETGGEVLESAADNPEGFWENRAVVDLNDQFLQRIGSAWCDPHPIQDIIWKEDFVEEFRRTASGIVLKEFKDSKAVVVKDPRMCRLFPLWRSAFETHFGEVKCIHVMRHYFEVSESLRKRNGFSHYLTTLLWIQHLLFSEIYSRPYARLTLNFSDLIGDSQSTVKRLAGFLDKSDDEIGIVERSINPKLRHNELPDDFTIPTNPATKCASELWNHWSSAAPFSVDSETDRYRSQFAKLMTAIPEQLRPVDEIRFAYSQAVTRLETANAELETANAELEAALVKSMEELEGVAEKLRSAKVSAENERDKKDRLTEELKKIKKQLSWHFSKALRIVERLFSRK